MRPLTLEQLTDETVKAYGVDADWGGDHLGAALADKALGYCDTQMGAGLATAGLQERDVRWFHSLTPSEARSEVLTRINAARAREAAQEAADDAANRRAGEAHDEAMMRVSHYIDGDPEDRR